jgi:hypothetical protein
MVAPAKAASAPACIPASPLIPPAARPTAYLALKKKKSAHFYSTVGKRGKKGGKVKLLVAGCKDEI